MKKIFLYIFRKQKLQKQKNIWSIFRVFLALLSLFFLLSKEVIALTYTIDFNTPSQYTLSSADQVFVNSGKAQLSERLLQRGQLLNGPNTIEAPNAVAVSGNYAYVGSYSNGGIQVFDISTPGSPVRV